MERVGELVCTVRLPVYSQFVLDELEGLSDAEITRRHGAWLTARLDHATWSVE